MQPSQLHMQARTLVAVRLPSIRVRVQVSVRVRVRVSVKVMVSVRVTVMVTVTVTLTVTVTVTVSIRGMVMVTATVRLHKGLASQNSISIPSAFSMLELAPMMAPACQVSNLLLRMKSGVCTCGAIFAPKRHFQPSAFP